MVATTRGPGLGSRPSGIGVETSGQLDSGGWEGDFMEHLRLLRDAELTVEIIGLQRDRIFDREHQEAILALEELKRNGGVQGVAKGPLLTEEVVAHVVRSVVKILGLEIHSSERLEWGEGPPPLNSDFLGLRKDVIVETFIGTRLQIKEAFMLRLIRESLKRIASNEPAIAAAMQQGR